jgi:hypothetical protein
LAARMMNAAKSVRDLSFYCKTKAGIGHILAVAVVWYLMFPPQAERSGMAVIGPDVSAPIEQWQEMRGEKEGESGAFRTKHECNDYRSKMLTDAKDKLLDAPPNVASMPSETRTIKWTFALGALSSKCIASDDSRLKAK